MADDKKKSAPAPAAPLFNKNHLRDTMIMLLGLFLLGFIYMRFRAYLDTLDPTGLNSLWQKIRLFFLWLWEMWKGVAVFIILLCLSVGIYSKRQESRVSAEVDKMYGPPEGATAPALFGAEKEKINEKWEKVLEHINSNNPSDWRLAIIEADIMLDELLRSAGYHGETVGDLLKAVEASDMLTLEQAWEAHKVRNRIAHSGSDFDLNEREAKRVIALFESVFKEFQII